MMGRPAPTRNGYDFFVVSSMLQKSLRRGDIVLASRACSELLPRYGNYCWNRMLIVSAEDCADLVTQEIVALWEAWKKIDATATAARPFKANIFFAKAIVILAKAKHSRDADELLCLVTNRLPQEEWERALSESVEVFDHDDAHFEIPEWVYDVHTRQGKQQGATREDFFRDEHAVMDTTMFGNFDAIVEASGWHGSDEYVEPELEFPSKEIK